MEAAQDLDREGIDIVTPLARVESELDKKSLYQRALGYLRPPSATRSHR